MRTVFGVEWEQLTLKHVREFLAGAPDEGLTWEAKGEEPRAGGNRLRPESVQRAVCGLSNQVGGWVILGARRQGEDWELPGITAPATETGLWIDQVLMRLRPVPRCAHRNWSLRDGGVVAVIQVQPLARTPCMTASGGVFERVRGQTLPVTDPVRLHELITRGQRARERAEAFAKRAAETGSVGPYANTRVRLSIGLAATSYEPDIGSRLFHSRFRAALEKRVETRLFRELHWTPVGDPSSIIQQDHIQWAHEAEQLYWVVRPSWDGSVGVQAALKPEVDAVFSLFNFAVWPTWKLAADLVVLLGSYGPAHLSFLLTVRNQSMQAPYGRTIAPFGHETLFAALRTETRIEPETAIAQPTDEEIASVQRELLRAAGKWVFERVPDPPAAPAVELSPTPPPWLRAT